MALGSQMLYFSGLDVYKRQGLECVSGGREAAFMHVRETQGDYLRRLDISG